MAQKFKKGDTVCIVKGRSAGKQGVIERVIPETQQLVVENLNLSKKHVKRTAESPGSIVDVAMPISWANVRLLCPIKKEMTKVSFKVIDGKKKRQSRVSGEVL